MKIKWYNRMLLSYAPIFFVVISSFIFIFFTALNSSSQNKYIATNKAIIQQMMQYTDVNLQLIERNVASEMYKNTTLQSFFTDEPKTIYDYYVIQKKLIEISSSFPFKNSIYLYDDSTRMVLTDSDLFTLDDFGDRSYFVSAYRKEAMEGWTNPRAYKPSPFDKEEKVVSIVKFYPFISDRQGAIGVNIQVNSIIRFLNDLNQNNNAIQIMDTDKRPFQAVAHSGETSQVYATSKYSGWHFYADGVLADEYSSLSLLSNIWTVLGLIIIVLAIVWFTVITHLKFKPIQTIIGKIEEFSARKSEGLGMKASRNELKFIESAIDQLLEKTVDYENLHKEDMLLRQRNLFQELITGHKTLTDAEWEKKMTSFGLPHTYGRLGVVALEIDHYGQFTERYSPSDQYLLKYIIETAFHELAQERDLFIWHAWVHPGQMAAVFHLHNVHEPYQDTLLQFSEEFRKWVNDNLEMTVSAGIGAEIGSISNLALSYRNANENVSYKTVFGMNSIIDNRIKNTRTNGEKMNWFQALLETAHFYRLDDEQWIHKLKQIFAGLNQTLLSKADVVNFVNNLVHLLQKEITSLSPEIQELWRNEYKERFSGIANRTETLDELHDQLITVMTQLAKDIEHERISRKNHTIAVRIKEYIDRNFADPNLSLNQVSDLYGVSPRSVSNLFKEELGEKFIDYLLKVRFAHAKQLLLETDEPVQNIAEKVGYTHVISFHRAFKKLFDLPPGEYRNLYRFHRE